MLVGYADRFSITAGECLRLTLTAAVVDGADGVNYVFGRQASPARYHGLAGRQASDIGDNLAALGNNGLASGAVDGPVNTASAHEGRIGGIHDCVGCFLGDIGGTMKLDSFAVLQQQAGYVVHRHVELVLVVQGFDSGQLFAFQKFQRGAASGRDMADLVGYAGGLYGRN